MNTEIFWEGYTNYKRKSSQKEQVRAGEDLINIAKGFEDFTVFGKYADLVKRWANAEVATNKFGAKLFIKFN